MSKPLFLHTLTYIYMHVVYWTGKNTLSINFYIFMQHTVTIYSTDTCHFCHQAKDYFKENNISFTDYNVGTDLAKRKEMVEKTKQMGVPVIVIDNSVMVGFNQPKIAELLGL